MKEIEKLNNELAAMGIHIIDAEFAGHKIKLREQPVVHQHAERATTIRYVIPSIRNQSSTNHPDKQSKPKTTTRASVPKQRPSNNSTIAPHQSPEAPLKTQQVLPSRTRQVAHSTRSKTQTVTLADDVTTLRGPEEANTIPRTKVYDSRNPVNSRPVKFNAETKTFEFRDPVQGGPVDGVVPVNETSTTTTTVYDEAQAERAADTGDSAHSQLYFIGFLGLVPCIAVLAYVYR